PTATELAAYEGTYVSDEAEATYTIRVRDGVLFAMQRPDRRLALTPAYKDAFTASPIPLFLFRRDVRGQVEALSLGLGSVRHLRFRRQRPDEAAPAAESSRGE